MRKRPIFETVVLSAALVFIPLVTRAALYGDSKVVAGIVKAVSGDSVTVTENAADGSQGNDITIQAQSATQYPDVQLKDLKEGDRIRVEYHEDQNLKVADSIAKDAAAAPADMAQ
jgi:capsid protein